ncbi:MAG: hypothetical protein ACO3F3_16650 [Gemmataceae bacterium]
MADIKDWRLLYLKGALFVGLGLLAAGIILIKYPDWQLALLMTISIWSFCRAYYFAFYVIEKYIDPSFKFASLSSLMAYLWKKRHQKINQ